MLVAPGVVTCLRVFAGISFDKSTASFFGLFRRPFPPGWIAPTTLKGAAVLILVLSFTGRPLAAQSTTSTITVGSAPDSVAINPITNQIFVANGANKTVSVINGADDSVAATVTMGNNPFAVAVDPTTNQAYVANYGDGTISVINGATDTATTVTVGSEPDAVVVDAATHQVYVANYGDGSVSVISEATNSVVATVMVGAGGSNPDALAVNPVTDEVYVANYTSGTVAVIDGTNNELVATLTAGSGPDAVAVNPVTNQVYVINNGSGTVTVINGATNTGAVTVTVGSAPDAVAVNPVTNQVYVINNGSGTATAINGATNIVAATVTVGSAPDAVAVNSVTNQVYVANRTGNTVSVVNAANNAVTTVATGTTPYAVAVNPATNQAYVVDNGNNTVTVISGASIPTTTLTVGTTPSAVAVNPVTNRAYVANRTSNTVSVINGATGSVVTTLAVGTTPYGVAVNPTTNQVYVINSGSNTVTVISGATNTVTATVALASSPFAVAVNPVTNQVFVTNNGTSGTVSVIDGTSNALIATLTVGINPCGLAVNPVTNQVYVANNQSNTASVIDGTTDTVTAAVTVGSAPYMVAVNPATNQIYVANQSGSVSVIDGTNNTLVTTLTVGVEPYAVAVNSVTNQIYVVNFTGKTVSVVDGVSNTVTATVTVGNGPDAAAVNPVTNQVYVANSSGSKVTVIDGASNSAGGVTVKNNPYALAVNPVTNQVYVANYGSASVSVINVDGTGGQQTVPITVTATAPNATADPLTVALPNPSLGTPYITMNPAPTVTATVNSAYTASNAYTNDTQTPSPINPAPTALYYQVDGGSGLWSQATVSSATGSNPASFSLPLTGQADGLHTLYLYAAYGNEGVPDGSAGGTGNSPEISNVTGFTYVVVPVPTTTTLIADANPQEPGDNVTFTATVSSSSGTTVPTGMVSFYDSISGTPVLLGTGNLAEVSGSDIAELQTSFAATGSHPITAEFEGDPNHAGSIGSLSEIIDTLTLTPTTLPAATVDVAYSQTLGASGGASGATYTYASTSGSLPSGLGLNASGVMSGTPTAAGSFSFTVTATDSSNSSLTGSQTYALTVAAPTITLTPASGTLNATAEAAYSQTFSASGGTAPYTYSLAVSSGTMPTGLSFNTASGVLSGTPTTSGTVSFTITAKDSSSGAGSPFTGTGSYTLTLGSPAITLTPTTLPAPTIAVAYRQTLSTSGGASPYTYSISAGALPAGLTLSSKPGVISGTPTAAGTFNFTATAKDTDGFTATQAYAFTIAAPTITLTPTTLPAPTIEVAYRQTLSASGGTSPYTYSISAGALPTGLTLSGTTGVISGTPAAAGTFNFTVTANDTNNFSASKPYSFTIAVPTITLTPASGTLNATAEAAYSQTFSASGGTAPYTYSLAVSSGTMPTGLSFNTASGVLSGTPTTSGTVSFTITANDSSSGAGSPFTGTGSYTLTLGSPAITLTPTTLPAPTIEVAYRQTLSTSGGASPYTYSISAGALPAGLTLSSTTGVISGTPTATGTFNFTVTAKDTSSFTATQAYAFTIVAPTLNLTPTTLPAPTIEVAYSQTVSATGGTSPYTYSISAGALPAGLKLSSATGVISGTPTATGTFNFTVTAKDTDGFTATQAYAFTIAAPTITLTPTTLPAGELGAPYSSQTFTAGGGISPYTYKVSFGALPTGLTLSSTGVLSGTPTLANTYNFTIVATDSSAGTVPYSGSNMYSILIAKQPSSTLVSVSPASAMPMQSVTLSAAVSATFAGTAAVPSGTVTFYNNGTILMSQPVTAGVATLTTLLPAAAISSITATYSGDGNFLSSTSSNNATVVAALDFTFTDTGTTTYTADPGSAATYNFSLEPLYGSYVGPVSFSVTGLPPGASASFTPNTVAADAGAAPVVMTVQTAAAIVNNRHGNRPFGREIVLALLLLPLLSKRRFREQLRGRMLLMVLLISGLTATLTGCGLTLNFHLRTYTLTVTATSGTLQHTQTVTLTAQ